MLNTGVGRITLPGEKVGVVLGVGVGVDVGVGSGVRVGFGVGVTAEMLSEFGFGFRDIVAFTVGTDP